MLQTHGYAFLIDIFGRPRQVDNNIKWRIIVPRHIHARYALDHAVSGRRQ